MKYKSLTYFLILFILSVFAFSSYAQDSAQSVTDSTSAEGENADNDSLMYSHPTYIYDSFGKKDPFHSQVPADAGEKIIKDLFSYEEATILGIVSSDTDSYALVTDKNGASYVLRVGDSVFGGHVDQISEDSIVLDIVKYARAMTIIMRLESSKYTVYEELDGQSQIRRPGITITYGKAQDGRKDIIVDEVTVQSLNTKFIEEEWFGPKEETVPQADGEPADVQSDLRGVIPLLEPNNKSWITLPHVFEWLNPDKIECVYTFIIYDDQELKNPIFIESDINTTAYLLGDDADIPLNRDLYWEVIAYELSGNKRINRQIVMSFKIKGQ
ncbi:hypothetical protein ACFL2X_02405 [Candidatus Latescibacterota bacterium]